MTLATFVVLSGGLGYAVYRLIVWQAHESSLRRDAPPKRDAVVSDAVVTDAVVTDAVVTDAVVTDAVVTDAVVSDAVVPEPLTRGEELVGREFDALFGDPEVLRSPLWEEARRTGAPDPFFVTPNPIPDSLMRSLNIIAGVFALVFLALLVGGALMVLSFCSAIASMG